MSSEIFIPLRTQAAEKLQRQIRSWESIPSYHFMKKRREGKRIQEILSEGRKEVLGENDNESADNGYREDLDIENQSSGGLESVSRFSLDRGSSRGTISFSDSKKVYNDDYKTYEGQVLATAEKYYNRDPLGASLVKAIVGLRTAFITGEEISISSDNKQFVEWAEKFLAKNKFHSDVLVPAVRALEITGQVIIALEPAQARDMTDYIGAHVVVYNTNRKIRPSFTKGFIKKFNGVQVENKDKGGGASWRDIPLDESTYVYICAGSSKTDTSIISSGTDDSESGLAGGSTDIPDICKTRIGAVLNYIDNYDRGMRDMRLLNAAGARITPSFKTEDPKNAAQIIKYLKKSGWEIGKAFVGSAELTYALPEHTGPQDGLTNELIGNIKSISSVTGVPVHWLGYTEILSNRSTAETLYEHIKNSTINDRGNVEYNVYDLIIKAQDMDDEISETETNFRVILPLIDFSSFDKLVRGLSQSYNDEAISLQDYRSALPGIDPIKTRRFIREEKANKEGRLYDDGRVAPNTQIQDNREAPASNTDTDIIDDGVPTQSEGE